MHIAFVTETWPPQVNGVALTVRTLALGLAARGHRVEVVRPGKPGSDGKVELIFARGAPLPRYPGLQVGMPQGGDDGVVTQSLMALAAIGLVALLVAGTIAVLVSRLITRPIPRLSEAMGAIAGGALQTEVPFTGFKNEVGAMARNVEVLRQNSARVVEMTDANGDLGDKTPSGLCQLDATRTAFEEDDP